MVPVGRVARRSVTLLQRQHAPAGCLGAPAPSSLQPAAAQRTDVRIAAALFSLAPGVINSKKFFLSKKELMKKEET